MAQLSLKQAWDAAQAAVIAGDAETLERVLRDHPELSRHIPPAYVPSGPGPQYRDTARAIIAREQQFESFADFQAHCEAARAPGSAVVRFEAAVEAIISGDFATLDRLLHDDPELIRARSGRTHHSTLLHYVGANGIEGFRQKTPANAVAITERLLAAGADVNAEAGMYGGGSTTLGLVATSIHPLQAGVQLELMELLLRHGARIEQRPGEAVHGCLANGRREAAELLAARGAFLDFENAAGVGRIDIVEQGYDAAGKLKPGISAKQLNAAFAWACQFGRTAVVECMVRHGIPLADPLPHDGQTGLHWAAYGGHADTVRVLLAHGAPVAIRDGSFDGTPLGWAVYGWGESGERSKTRQYHEVVEQLVAAGATLDPGWLDEDDRGFPLREMIRADARMAAALKAFL